MQTNQYTTTTTILKPESGYVLTQSDPDTPILGRIIAKEIVLGKFDAPENWIEITESQADEIRAEQTKLHDDVSDE